MLTCFAASPIRRHSASFPHSYDLRLSDVHPGRFSLFLPHTDKSKTINVTEKKG